MLGKLIKYDLKSMLKTIVPLWITVIVLSGIFAIKYWGGATNTMDMGNNTFDLVLFIVLFSVAVAIVVMNILFVVQRFWNGLLKEEGYLMFTLPVTTRSLIMSKALSALIISLGSMLVAMLSISIFSFAFVQGAIDVNALSTLWLELKNALLLTKGSQFAEVVVMIAAGVVSFLAAIYQVYASMAIGQLSNKNRFLLSFIAFVGITVVLSMFASVTNMFTMGNSLANSCISLIVNLITLIIFHIITEVLLTRKLNLE